MISTATGSASARRQRNSFADTTVQSATNYTYTVSAVNRDGVESAQSASIVAALPGIASYDWIDSNDIEIYFNQPLTAASAGTLANYSITAGGERSPASRFRSTTRKSRSPPTHALAVEQLLHDHDEESGNGVGQPTAEHVPAIRHLPIADRHDPRSGLGQLGRRRRRQRSDQSGLESQLSEQSHVPPVT